MYLGSWPVLTQLHCYRYLHYPDQSWLGCVYMCCSPDYDTSQWTNEKEKLGLDFPNLPYLIDGQTKLTQSNAILRYVARKHKMAGESEEEIQRVDMLENQVMDFRLAFARICYSPDFEKLKPEYLEQLPGKLKLFSQFLGVRKWFAGEKRFPSSCLAVAHAEFLAVMMGRGHALEKIAAYLSSSRSMKTPIFWRTAQWSNKKE
uniref:Glutathione S-transferase n=1 Tax=Chrysemys picta bellii TaxID=8478 RepID=A0A8C3FJ53_CHRPI